MDIQFTDISIFRERMQLLRAQGMDFLRELAANNHKPWMDANRDRYKAVKSRMDAVAKDFIKKVTERCVGSDVLDR